MLKHVRELVDFAARYNIKATDAPRKNTHRQLTLEKDNGETFIMFIAASPSDHLALANNKAMIKRFARGVIREYTRK